MKYRFGIKLTITMLAFAIASALLIAITDYFRLRDLAIEKKMEQVRQIESMAQYALETVEKAYELFGNNVARKMEEYSLYLVNLYEQNPRLEEWDFTELKHMFDMDIYLIDRDNVIRYSSFPSDIGLDFTECCPKLAKVLDERRNSGQFFHDGIDLEQQTGQLKKYSYMATPDKQYLIQLGYNLENSYIFREFNFINAIRQFAQAYPHIIEIHVLNHGGLYLGVPANDDYQLSPERRRAYEQTLQTGQTTEYRGTWGNQPAVYRYVKYVSKYDQGATQAKVLEIVYNEQDLQAILGNGQRVFMFQLLIIVAFAIALSFIVSRWVARPMYLAFHDSLTGLNNRAALDELLQTALANRDATTAVLMIDLDNFKQVNDLLGHHKGDQLLKSVAQAIRRTARKKDHTIRMGGDEFLLIMPSVSRQEAEKIAGLIIEEVVTSAARVAKLEEVKVTVSIGIAFAPQHGIDRDTLLKKADLAMYKAKEKGKNQYQVYA